MLRHQLSLLEIPIEDLDTDMTREEREEVIRKKVMEGLEKVKEHNESFLRDREGTSMRLQSTVEIERPTLFRMMQNPSLMNQTVSRDRKSTVPKQQRSRRTSIVTGLLPQKMEPPVVRPIDMMGLLNQNQIQKSRVKSMPKHKHHPHRQQAESR